MEQELILGSSDSDVDNIRKDYEISRDNLEDFMDKGKEGLEVALEMAKSLESPRAIEVFSTLLKTVSDINKQYLELRDSKISAEINVEKKLSMQNGGTTINNNAYFIGNMDEINKLFNGTDDGSPSPRAKLKEKKTKLKLTDTRNS